MIYVSIIIVNYNTRQLIVDCINSIIKNTLEINYEIIVVDNNSADDSCDYIKKQFPKVILIENNDNVGFGRANNIGATRSKGKYVLFLNSDTVLDNDAVSYFYKYFESFGQAKNIGALGSWLRDSKGVVIHSYSTFPSMRAILKERFKVVIKNLIFYSYLKKFRSVKQNCNENKQRTNLGIKKVDYITGADLFMEKELFKALGGFNRRFFMYFEETELQFRLNNLNKNRYIISEPKIIHLEGKSLKLSDNKKKIFDNGMLFYFKTTRKTCKFLLFKVFYFLIFVFTYEKERTFEQYSEYIKMYWQN
ncbi:glycosyltransferase family 2 protein [Clostridium akagii]|uniref:glycosyltransferase family 2 protein n=1 Tax=Clostridium akagii TaxID=91623 RepID=UPI000567BCA9|nr:glycosyltransferase family 2 protein [Clostridium akagii]